MRSLSGRYFLQRGLALNPFFLKMEFKRFGDQTCIICFEEKISHQVHHQVMSAYQFFHAAKIKGITELIPSYNSLTIVFNPKVAPFEELKMMIENVDLRKTEYIGRVLRMPVCYENAVDQDVFCHAIGLSWLEIVDIHISSSYLVYMMGFLPGFLYMGEVDKTIRLPRKKTPRKKVEAGSVGIAGAQTGVYPITSPGGWNILGRTPISLFNPSVANPFPVDIGDEIIFYPITESEFMTIRSDKSYKMEEINGS